MNKTFISHSKEETQRIAKTFAETLLPKDFIGLSGNLGAGKTEFVRGLVQQLCGAVEISSPTFTLMNIYDPKIEKGLPVYHFDFYRIQKEVEIYDLGFEEFFYGDGISVVEWSERFPELLPPNRYEILLNSISENEREITIIKF